MSFVVADLRLVEAFYVDFLGCKKGRDTGRWIDVIFYGHQLTLHQETTAKRAQSIDHFGVILDKAEWLSIIQKMDRAKVPYILSPDQKTNEDESESGKFIIKDPASNLLEFKFYKKSPLENA